LSGRVTMAEVFLNPAFTSISGRVGNVVFFSYGGRTFFRAYVVPCNPDTPAQRSNRRLFSEAMKAWQRLSLFDKNAYNRRARRLGMTGHNLFISRYMIAQSNNSGSGTSQGALGADSKATLPGFTSFQVRGHSVPGSVVIHERQHADSAHCPWHECRYRDQAHCAPAPT